MVLRWTKKPAYVIWYKAESALMRVAIPPFSNTMANKKFYERRRQSAKITAGCRCGDLTQSVITRVYKTRINRNLKKCAASFARPAIQYVLDCPISQCSATNGQGLT